MRPRLITILVLLVALPLAMVIWLGVRAAADESQLREQRLAALLEGRLSDVETRVASIIEQRASGLARALEDLESYDVTDLRAWVWQAPLVDQVFVLEADGRLVHPPLRAALSDAEREFLLRSRRLFEQGLLVAAANASEFGSSQQLSIGERQVSPGTAQGWYAWYWDSGLHLIFWTRADEGRIVGCEVNRARVVADILNDLSGLTVGGGEADAIVLTDSRGRTLQRWGGSDDRALVRAERSLRPPLGAWHLTYLRPPEQVGSASATAARWLAVMLMTVALAGLGLMFYRESTRELRAAAQRVSFVNQVSHELRTPLTNIRLYAELLLDRRGDEVEIREPLQIIVAESQRLSRLIGNVLSFARRQRGELRVRPRSGDLGTTVTAVVERFNPALEAKGITSELSVDGDVVVDHDADAVEQIVGNLLNNVEKYAAGGGWVRVSVGLAAEGAVVAVEDRGPGVPADRADEVFEPFVRLSSQLSEGVSGTGIGLSLSRDLARLHGGELVLVPGSDGARFELRLPLCQGRSDNDEGTDCRR